MPDGTHPGPNGHGCGEQFGGPAPQGSPEDLAAASQPGTIARVVEMRDDLTLALGSSPRQGGSSWPPSLGANGRPAGATTGGPHVHERWGESRKLELS
jgi:hypothetical protein